MEATLKMNAKEFNKYALTTKLLLMFGAFMMFLGFTAEPIFSIIGIVAMVIGIIRGVASEVIMQLGLEPKE